MTLKNLRGISLIEVLAALVILSLGASIAFSWFGQSVAVMGKLKAEEVKLLAENEATEALRAINPIAQPAGELVMPGYRVRWTSQVIGEPLSALTTLGTAARYQVSLHDLSVELRKDGDDHQVWSKFTLALAGYKQVSGGSMSLFKGSSLP